MAYKKYSRFEQNLNEESTERVKAAMDETKDLLKKVKELKLDREVEKKGVSAELRAEYRSKIKKPLEDAEKALAKVSTRPTDDRSENSRRKKDIMAQHKALKGIYADALKLNSKISKALELEKSNVAESFDFKASVRQILSLKETSKKAAK